MCDIVGEGDRDFIRGGGIPLPGCDLIDRVGDGDLVGEGFIRAFLCKGFPCKLAYFDLCRDRIPVGRFQYVWDPKPLAGEVGAMSFVLTVSVSSFLVVVSVQLVIVTAGGNKLVMSRITVKSLLYTMCAIDR
jgi:hypothetical protein